MAISTLPATAVQRHDHWAESTAGASVVKTKIVFGQKEALRARCAFFMPLPAFVPGTIGVLHVQAIGMEPARTSCWPPAAWRITTSVRSVSVFWRFKAALSANGAPAASSGPR